MVRGIILANLVILWRNQIIRDIKVSSDKEARPLSITDNY